MFSLVSRFSGKLLPILALCCCVAGVARGQATSVYVTQNGSAAGSCTGSPLLSAAQFNNSASWGTGSSQIGPGTTVHLCGTFTGSAGSTMLALKGSGTSGHPITLRFESGAALKAPYWSSSGGAINAGGRSYIVIDGGSNGLIENTLNGSPGASCPGGSCSNQQSSKGIYADPCVSCEFKNLTIADIYVHKPCEGSSGCDTTLNAFTNAEGILFSGNNVSIHNLVIHDVGGAIVSHFQNGQTGTTIYNNDIYNIDHGLFVGPCKGCTYGTLSIHDNHIHDSVNWDSGSADWYHHDGIHFWDSGSPYGTTNELDIYNNLFDGNEGQCCITAWIFLQGAAAVNNIYNNVIVPTGPKVSNGGLSMRTDASDSRFNIYNNTFISAQASGGTTPAITYLDAYGGSASVSVKNNAFAGFNTYIALPSSDVRSLEASNNAYASESGGGNPYWVWNSIKTKTLAAWQSSCGCDSSSVGNLSGSLGIVGEGVPGTSFIGASKGANLMSLASGAFLALSSDTSAGDTRAPSTREGGTLDWDIGAYVAGNSNRPTAPTGLTATVQ